MTSHRSIGGIQHRSSLLFTAPLDGEHKSTCEQHTLVGQVYEVTAADKQQPTEAQPHAPGFNMLQA